MKFTDLQSCPFCGSEMYYEKQGVKGRIEFNSMFNGEEAPNYELYDYISHTYTGRCYCRECNKYLGNNKKNIVGKEAERLILKSEAEQRRNGNADIHM